MTEDATVVSPAQEQAALDGNSEDAAKVREPQSKFPIAMGEDTPENRSTLAKAYRYLELGEDDRW